MVPFKRLLQPPGPRLAGGRAGRAEAGERLRRQRHGGGAGSGARLPRLDPNSLFIGHSAVIGYTQQCM